MIARCLPLLLGMLIVVRANGEPAPPPPAAPDFSAGFTQLAALGLPALDANATWSTLPDAAGGGDYQLRELFKSLKGNGWSLPPPPMANPPASPPAPWQPATWPPPPTTPTRRAGC
jgi:hypothetical protein